MAEARRAMRDTEASLRSTAIAIDRSLEDRQAFLVTNHEGGDSWAVLESVNVPQRPQQIEGFADGGSLVREDPASLVSDMVLAVVDVEEVVRQQSLRAGPHRSWCGRRYGEGRLRVSLLSAIGQRGSHINSAMRRR